MGRGSYDIQQVCLNGHQITTMAQSSPERKKEFCDKCGKKCITNCPSCNHPIKGYYSTPGVVSFGKVSIPSHCEKCGDPYPWTETESVESAAINSISSLNLENSIVLIKKMCQRFHLVVRQLQNRYNERSTIEINDEYDVQDLLHSLLRLNFDDVRAEEYTPSYAGAASRIDFLLHDQEIAIEVKKTRQGLKDKQVGEQIAVDIQRYESHPRCKVLICFVYDPEARIGNPAGLERDLTKKIGELEVITIICPKGH